MLRVKLLLTILSTIAVAQGSEEKTLYLLSLLPQPDSTPSLQPSIDTGPMVVTGGRQAVSRINNRSDILKDYKLDLIEADDGCNVTFKALTSLIEALYYSDKQIVGIVGPLCSEAAKAISPFAAKEEVSLLVVHLASSQALADRKLYPYSFGIRGSIDEQIGAIAALFEYNKWTSVAVLYSQEMLIDYSSFELFRSKVDGNVLISYSSPTYDTYIPLKDIKSGNSRVICVFSQNLAQNILCLGLHMNMTYPDYQWIFNKDISLMNITFNYGGVEYSCSDRQLLAATEGAIFLNSKIEDSNSKDLETIGGNIDDIEMEYFEKFADRSGDDAHVDPDAFNFYDAVWAMAVALNNSIAPLKAKGLSLANYSYGFSAATKIVQQQMYMLNFKGISGRIQFNPYSGYLRTTVDVKEVINGSRKIIAQYSNDSLDVLNFAAFLTSSEIAVEHLHVLLWLAVFFISAQGIAFFIIAVVHVLNMVCSEAKSVKASSTRLNHFAYVGCYLVLLAIVIYSVMESSSISLASKTVLCNAFPWCLVVGCTLVLSTVCVKTWRLYCIFVAFAKKNQGRTAVKDTFLAFWVVVMTLVAVAFCATWSALDPLVRVEVTVSTSSRVKIETDVCQSKHLISWLIPIALYEIILIVLCVFLAFLTRNIRMKEFQTRGIFVLAYLLFLTTGGGVILYAIAVQIQIDINVPYAILCLSLSTLVYLCIFLLFFPPIIPLLIPNRTSSARATAV